MDLDKVEFNVEESISNICDMLSLKARQKGITLQAYYPKSSEAPKKLIGDERRLQQVQFK